MRAYMFTFHLFDGADDWEERELIIAEGLDQALQMPKKENSLRKLVHIDLLDVYAIHIHDDYLVKMVD